MSTEKNFWTKKKTSLLISNIEMYPELWDVSMKEYRDKNQKNKAINIIAEVVGTTEKEITRKFHNLRCQMNSEIRKLKKKKSGDGADDVLWDSNWEYFDSLKFMYGRGECLSNTRSLISDQFYPAVSEIILPPEPKPKSTPKRKMKEIEEESLHNAVAILNKPLDDNTIFGDYVASELRQIKSEQRRRRLRIAIQKCIIAMEEEEEFECYHSTPDE